MHHKENLARLKQMNELAPEVMKAFWAFDKAAVAEGVIPVKYKELIAVAVALTTQCPYCIDIHSVNARKAGATDAEITEAAMVAAALRAGGAPMRRMHFRRRFKTQIKFQTVSCIRNKEFWLVNESPARSAVNQTTIIIL